MARLTFPRMDYSVSLDNNPFSNDPEIKRLTKMFRAAERVRDGLHDAHRKAMGLSISHAWEEPKDPKVKKAMADARKAVDDIRIELRQAFKERGIDIGAQHQANMDLLKAIEKQSKEAMRKAGLGETLERLEAPKTSMGWLIEACEQELVEVSPEAIINTGRGVALAMMTAPIWAPIAGKAIEVGSNALIDRLPKSKGRLAMAMDARRNKAAEQCHQKGGDNCLCADGFHYDRGAKKCMKNTLGSGIKRFFKKK